MKVRRMEISPLHSTLDAARENAYSRMLVGIHFRRACEISLKQGRDVAQAVLERAPFPLED